MYRCDKPAVLARMGSEWEASDDLGAPYHREGGNRERILGFANRRAVVFYESRANACCSRLNAFDVVMLNDIIKHLHPPRDLLNSGTRLLGLS